MSALTWPTVARYRSRLLRRHRIRTKGQALHFIEAVGFCYAFTPGPGNLPGLFDVLATRSVDRMWSWSWQWKDELATGKRVFYGKVLRRKPTYISLSYLPYFYALSGNVGDADDHLQAYREGRLSLLAKDVFEYVRAHGPCSTWVLRRQFVPRGNRGAPFQRALGDLQSRFLLARVGELEAGSFSFIWDTFGRWLPQAVRAAARTPSERAAAAVFERYLRTVGAISPRVATDLLAWPPRLLDAARDATADAVQDGRIDGEPVLVHRHLISSTGNGR